MLTLQEVKQYLKIEPDITEDDELIEGLIIAAEQYIYNATGNTFGSENKLAALLGKIIIADWYENRELTYQSKFTENTHRIASSMLSQLQYCYGEDDTK